MDGHKAILELEARRCQAMIAGDARALGELFSHDLTWTHSSARQDTRETFLAGLDSGGTRYLEISRSEETVRLYGDVAVVTGFADMRATLQGEERKLRNRYTNVWVKSGDLWKMVAWQSTAAPVST